MFSRKITTILAATAVAVALGVFAGPSNGASGVPINSCLQTVTTNAFLAKDLSCPNSDGIKVGSSGITIDLKGHVLSGNGGGWGISQSCACDRITIKNGVVHDFALGIAFVSADHVTLSGVVVVGNWHQGVYIGGASASIKSSTVAGNSESGIQIVGDSASITSAAADDNGLHGIWVAGNGASVTSTRAVGNASNGVLLEGNASSVVRTTVSGNASIGLGVAGNAASVRSTTASGNAGDGIRVMGDAATLKGNRAEGNGFPGGASDGVGAGIRVYNFATAPTGKNVARGNDEQAECQPASLCPAAAAKNVRAGWKQITACGQAVTTNAVLTQDLACAGSGIVVASSGVTIDLNGHVLQGNGGWVGIGNGCVCDLVTIKNGVVRNFGIGIDLTSGADNVSVSNVVSAGNTQRGIQIQGTSASVKSSSASGNGWDGILVTGEKASIMSTTAAGNGVDGVSVKGDGASLKSSTVVGNASYGVEMQSNVASVASTTVSGNAAYGLVLTGNDASVSSTTATGNRTVGIDVIGDAASLKGNRLEGNGFSGPSDGFGLGLLVTNFTTSPVGKNVARGNDDLGECQPSALC